MKLLSLNIEGSRHLEQVISFIDREATDLLCLQEATEKIRTLLHERGYETTFLPTIIHERESAEMGVMVASKHPYEATSEYYFKPQTDIVVMDEGRKRETVAQGYICADIEVGNEHFSVITTHFTWTPDGDMPNEDQKEDMRSLLALLRSSQPHVLCGDMNIPRSKSPLYQEFISTYTDAIPPSYNSSLDRTLHRFGNDPKKQKLFNDFMVDYVFTQKPYVAEDVRLSFGVSDHAGITANLHRA